MTAVVDGATVVLPGSEKSLFKPGAAKVDLSLFTAADEAASLFQGAPVVRFGRPQLSDAAARERELLRLVAGGSPLHDAAVSARVSPKRVLRLLADPAFRSAVVALLEAHERAA